MAFNGSFFTTKSATASNFTLTDDSTGSDGNLTGRTIYLRQASGDLLVAAIPWAIADTSITLSVLEQDVALNIEVVWASSSPLGSPSTYTYSQINYFTQYGENFYYSLTQQQTGNPTIIQDENYYNSKMTLRVELDSASQAIDVGNDLYASQSCIDRYTFLINNQNYFY